MSSTVSIAQYAARAEAAEAKIAELTTLAAQIQAVAGGGAGSTSGEGIGEFKNYFLEKLKTLRVAVAEEHEEFLRTQAKNADLEKEVTKLRYRVEILTRELSSQLGTPVPESIFKDSEAEVKNESSKKGKDKEKDKGKEKGNEKGDKEKGNKEKGDKEKSGKDKGKDKEKSKDDRKPSEKSERKPSEKSERKPSERKQSEKVETQVQSAADAAEPAVTVHATEGADKGKKAAKGKDQNKKEDATAESGDKKDNKKGGDAKKGGEKPKKDSTRTESQKGEGASGEQSKKGGKQEGAKKGGDGGKKGGDAAKTTSEKPKEEPKTEAKAGGLDEKAVKACLKEGGKKAQDCVGMSTFGTHFFCVTIESAEGNMKLLEKVMEGMNAEVDPEAEDRKGGAGDLGKILFNADDKKLVIMCHTPQEVMEKATAAEWMANVLTATGAKVTSQSENYIQAELDNDPDHGVYSLKLRDQGISASFEFLRSKGLMIDDDSEDENYAAAAGINLNAAPGSDY